MTEGLRDLFPPLPLPAEMRQWDAGAMAMGLPELLLMENAARAALDVLRQYRPQLKGLRVWLLMGGGNNGGDAACLARHLLDAGAVPLVLAARPLAGCKGAGARHVRLARAAGVPFRRCPAAFASLGPPPDILVDGLLGTGFHGMLRPDTLALVRAANALDAPLVLALDLPSGLDGRSGRPCPEAVRATATVAFAAAKPGLLAPHAAAWTGALHVRDIGIPRRVREDAPCALALADGHCLCGAGLPAPGSHKNDFGHVLVAGGAPGMGGAAHLAARAALRCGAGLVTAAAPAAGLTDIRNGWAEIMTLALHSQNPARWPDSLSPALRELLSRCAAVVAGPGMGHGEDAAAFLAALLALPERPPMVLDADALNLLASAPPLRAFLRPDDVLTPHPGEAARLLACPAAEVQAERLRALEGLCDLTPGVVILKGAGTLIGRQGMTTLLCPYAVPQLAMGGSGDVLAGCLGGLMAAHARREESARRLLPLAGQAVALHALAGRSLARDWPRRGCRASDLADALPRTLNALAAQQPEGDRLPWPA